MSKHDLNRDSLRGRATDWETRLREESASLSNSKLADVVDVGNPDCGVSLWSVRETTQSRVKVPKCGLSVIEGCLEP